MKVYVINMQTLIFFSMDISSMYSASFEKSSIFQGLDKTNAWICYLLVVVGTNWKSLDETQILNKFRHAILVRITSVGS